MNVQRFVLALALTVALAASVLMPGLASLAQAQDPDNAAAACTADFKQKWMPKGNCKTSASSHFLGTLDNQPLVIKTNAAERMRIHKNGNVGIGTANPSSKLEIAAQDGLAITGFQPFLTLRDTNAGGARAILASGKGDLAIYPNSFIGGSPSVIFKSGSGSVGIGTPSPVAKLTVRGGGSILAYTLRLETSDNKLLLGVNDIGRIFIAEPGIGGAKHLCLVPSATPDGVWLLTECSSNAASVPSVDGGKGYPDTADLVSLAPNRTIPYGDTHAPFAVQKSTTSCDSHLLGFIANLESGDDDEETNEQYLPLAISGSFPAKVTMENGAIKSGDAITSSSKAGYGMKATGPCKIIGYALEDANAEGTIQVFAHLSESTLPVVDALMQENRALKQQLAAIEARIAAIEQAAPVTQSSARNNSFVVK